MVEKVRGIVDQLTELEDAVRVEDLRSRLKTIREDAIRQLKDRQDLFEDGGDAIRLGKHRFAVNTQPVDITTVLRDGSLCLHLTGTQFFEPLQHPDLEAARDLWQQELISENDNVYRAEYLAVDLFDQGLGKTDPEVAVLNAIGKRLSEGYVKGVHDGDATRILEGLWKIHGQIGLLRFEPSVRAAGRLWWDTLIEEDQRVHLVRWIEGFANLAKVFPGARPAAEFRQRLTQLIQSASICGQEPLLFPEVQPEQVAEYLFAELVQGSQPVVSQTAIDLYKGFMASFADDRQNQAIKELTTLCATRWVMRLFSHATGQRHFLKKMPKAQKTPATRQFNTEMSLPG